MSNEATNDKEAPAPRAWVRVWRVRTTAERLPATWGGRDEVRDRALQAQLEAAAIGCAGPGVGDVVRQRIYSAADIGSAVQARSTLALPADIAQSVTAVAWRMLPGDLVLLWGHQRAALVEIAGDYAHLTNETDAFKLGYEHTRPVRVLSTEAAVIVRTEELCGSFDGDSSHMVMQGRREVDAAHIRAMVDRFEAEAAVRRAADAARAEEMAKRHAVDAAAQAAQAAQAALHEQQRVRERAVEALRAAEAAATEAEAAAAQKAEEAQRVAAALGQ